MKKPVKITLVYTLFFVLRSLLYAEENLSSVVHERSLAQYSSVVSYAEDLIGENIDAAPQPKPNPAREAEESMASTNYAAAPADYTAGSIGISFQQFLNKNRNDFSANLYALIFVTYNLAFVAEIGLAHHQLDSFYVGLKEALPVSYRARSLGLEGVVGMDYRLRLNRYFAISLSMGIFYQHQLSLTYDKISSLDFDPDLAATPAFRYALGNSFKVGVAITFDRLEIPIGYTLRFDIFNFRFNHGFYVGMGVRL
jgi:hypothetical protein